MPPKAPKAPITCNWMRSDVTDDTLADFVKTGYLPKRRSCPIVPLTRRKKDLNQEMERL